MTPAAFRTLVYDLADRLGLPRERVILGGDHLGPNPWRSQPAHEAMAKARALVRDCVLAGYDKIHTDYQTRDALRRLVEDHFAILKVGPALTFAFREAVFALAMIETELLSRQDGIELSRIQQAVDNAMLARPAYWQSYYAGSERHVQFARRYSFGDRSRYYWTDPGVQESLARLLGNLEEHPIPLTLLSQFLPVQYERVRRGVVANAPRELICDKIRSVLADYAYACGYH